MPSASKCFFFLSCWPHSLETLSLGNTTKHHEIFCSSSSFQLKISTQFWTVRAVPSLAELIPGAWANFPGTSKSSLHNKLFFEKAQLGKSMLLWTVKFSHQLIDRGLIHLLIMTAKLSLEEPPKIIKKCFWWTHFENSSIDGKAYLIRFYQETRAAQDSITKEAKG